MIFEIGGKSYNHRIVTTRPSTHHLELSDSSGIVGYLELTNNLSLVNPGYNFEVEISGSKYYIKDVDPAYTRLKFQGNADKTKSNKGTRGFVWRDNSGKTVASISGGDYYVCPTYGTKTHNLAAPIDVNSRGEMTFTRKIDTSSNGWATMKVWGYRNDTLEWEPLIFIDHNKGGSGCPAPGGCYRTGSHTATDTWFTGTGV